MLKLRVCILSALLLGTATVVAAEHGPQRFCQISFRFPTFMES